MGRRSTQVFKNRLEYISGLKWHITYFRLSDSTSHVKHAARRKGIYRKFASRRNHYTLYWNINLRIAVAGRARHKNKVARLAIKRTKIGLQSTRAGYEVMHLVRCDVLNRYGHGLWGA